MHLCGQSLAVLPARTERPRTCARGIHHSGGVSAPGSTGARRDHPCKSRIGRGPVQANRSCDANGLHASAQVAADTALELVQKRCNLLRRDSCQCCGNQCMALRVGTCVSFGSGLRDSTRRSTAQPSLLHSARAKKRMKQGGEVAGH